MGKKTKVTKSMANKLAKHLLGKGAEFVEVNDMFHHFVYRSGSVTINIFDLSQEYKPNYHKKFDYDGPCYEVMWHINGMYALDEMYYKMDDYEPVIYEIKDEFRI